VHLLLSMHTGRLFLEALLAREVCKASAEDGIGKQIGRGPSTIIVQVPGAGCYRLEQLLQVSRFSNFERCMPRGPDGHFSVDPEVCVPTQFPCVEKYSKDVASAMLESGVQIGSLAMSIASASAFKVPRWSNSSFVDLRRCFTKDAWILEVHVLAPLGLEHFTLQLYAKSEANKFYLVRNIVRLHLPPSPHAQLLRLVPDPVFAEEGHCLGWAVGPCPVTERYAGIAYSKKKAQGGAGGGGGGAERGLLRRTSGVPGVLGRKLLFRGVEHRWYFLDVVQSSR